MCILWWNVNVVHGLSLCGVSICISELYYLRFWKSWCCVSDSYNNGEGLPLQINYYDFLSQTFNYFICMKIATSSFTFCMLFVSWRVSLTFRDRFPILHSRSGIRFTGKSEITSSYWFFCELILHDIFFCPSSAVCPNRKQCGIKRAISSIQNGKAIWLHESSRSKIIVCISSPCR